MSVEKAENETKAHATEAEAKAAAELWAEHRFGY